MVGNHRHHPSILFLLLTLLLTTNIVTAAVTKLTIVNVDTSTDSGVLQDGKIYVRADLPPKLSIRADVDTPTKQLEFFVNGAAVRIEKGAPYTITGDSGPSAYRPWNVPVDKETTLRARQVGSDGKIEELEITFQVVTTVPPPSATPTPSVSAKLVVGDTTLTIIDVSDNSEFGPLVDGAVFATGALPTSYSVRANVKAVSSAKNQAVFYLDGVKVRTENGLPYSISGDKSGDFYPWTGAPAKGGTIKVEHLADGAVVDTLEITFTIGGTPPTITPDGTVTATPTPTMGPPSVTPTPSSSVKPTVGDTSLTIMDASDDSEFGPLVDGAVFATGALPTSYSVRANVKAVSGAKNQAVFYLDGVKVRTENGLPYSISGDKSGDFYPWTGAPAKGGTIKVEHLADGKVVDTLEVTYTVGGDIPTITPTPTSDVTATVTVSATPTPTMGGSPPPPALSVNFGSTSAVDEFIGDDGTYVEGSTSISSGSGDGIFKSHRWGKNFNLAFPLTPGKYNIKLFFAENHAPNCAIGKRVFNVQVGDQPELKNLDVFAKTETCATPYEELFTDVQVDDKLIVKFTMMVQNAFISGIEITSGLITDTPTPTITTVMTSAPPTPTMGGVDPGAHAVPSPFDKPIIDKDNDGKHTVTMDGSGSHTHYSDGGVFATLTNFKWSNNETKEVLCEGPMVFTCTHTFGMGATNVELCVTDSSGEPESSQNCAVITVTVVESPTPGAYCYYYNDPATTGSAMPLKMGLETEKDASPKPLFGAPTDTVNFPSSADFPEFSFKTTPWAQRCVFFFTSPVIDTYQFTIKHTGAVGLFVGDEEVIAADGSDSTETSEGSIEIPEGLQKMDLIYYKKGSTAQLELSYNATGIEFQYDAGMLLPILESVSPTEVPETGGGVLVKGLNFDKEQDINFGVKQGTSPLYDDAENPTQVEVNAPASSPGKVKLTVSSLGGYSNSLPFEYTGKPPVPKFSTKILAFKPQGVSNIAIGPDHKYYMSTYQGKVIVADIDHEDGHTLKSSCESAPLLDDNWKQDNGEPAPRFALGIAFNRADKVVKAYVATSTLFWGPGEKNYLKGDFAWTNGNVEIIEPKAGGCVERTGFLITGLPVSNHDHAVNSMVFDSAGNLHIEVGGFTNAGIPGKGLGDFDENPLSGASLIALTSKGTFDGIITYDNKDPAIAKQTGGLDVQVYASGLRNSFGIAHHTNGKFYVTDNGPNKRPDDHPRPFGEASDSCTTKSKDPSHKDKVILLEKGKFYGHPNRNRGECIFVNEKGLTTSGAAPPASSNYAPNFATVQSSTNGIMEYTANTFSGQLKGDLFASRFQNNNAGSVKPLYRFTLNADGTKKDGAITFNPESGLSIALMPDGSFIAPQVQKNQIAVIEPVYDTEPAGLEVIAVTPFRGGKNGGNVVLITGFNFGSSPTALFGSKACADVTVVSAKSFKCTTPAGAGLVDVTVSAGGVSAIASKGFWYLDY